MENTPPFDFEKSPAKEAYLLLNAKTPLELSNRYTQEDQKLMNSKLWDYNNPDLIINQAKRILESVDPMILTREEQVWRQEIIWFWYHHAISCAIAKYGDKEAAQRYAAMALENQPPGHPNKITKLLSLLVNDKIDEAEKYLLLITEEPEKSTGQSLLLGYKQGLFFK